MKKIFYIAVPLSVFLASCSPVIVYRNVPPPQQAPQQPVYADQPQTDQVFYDALSPYGNWIDYPDYGYVWQPNVGEDFRPYSSNGNWVYADEGWTWVSNYSWGWAPFHYGRWFYDGGYGWLWMPGQQWAPAWVTWGQSDSYYGWAPVPPRVEVGTSYRPRTEDWNFVPATNITNVNVNRYVVRNNITVINKTVIINNVTNNYITNNYNSGNGANGGRGSNGNYNRGPRVNDVESITNTRIQPVKINGSAKPGQSLNNNQLNVYRPVIKQAPAQGDNKPAPTKVVTYNPGGRQNGKSATGPGMVRNPNQQGAANGNGQGTDPNNNQQTQKTGNGQGNGFNNGQQNPGNGNGQGNGHNPNQQGTANGNGQNNNPNGGQDPKPGNGQGIIRNPNQPSQTTGNGNNANPAQPQYGGHNSLVDTTHRQNHAGAGKPVTPANPNLKLIKRPETVHPAQNPQNPKPVNGQSINPNKITPKKKDTTHHVKKIMPAPPAPIQN